MAFAFRVNIGVTSLALCACILPGIALGECSVPLTALAKSWQQTRLAQYDVDSPEQALPKTPAMIHIGKLVWTDSGPGGLVRNDAPSENPLAIDMKRSATKGEVNCELVGNATYRGQSVVKYKLDPAAATFSLGRVTLWISKTSGLPVFHEYEKLPRGGYAWVYGDAVKEPTGK